MTAMPTIFVSHGAPTLVTDRGRTPDFLRALSQALPRPSAILCVSAHWETEQPMLTSSPAPPTIHDFFGFPQELYTLHYAAPGDPALALRAQTLLTAAGLHASLHPQRGLDHGAWVPLLLAFPQADIPVVQLSVQPQRDAAHHFALGRALRPLRDAGVLILASGGATHNLREFRGQAINTAPPDYVLAFDAWLTAAITRGDAAELLDYPAHAPHALRNHPTPEHFLPLLVALGAADSAVGRALHEGFNYGILSMAAYAWDN
ncbi:MAG: dioxygenase [Gammaproteobacteria bacterium]|nr:dioxygenase [Gammaproteobacteria bacterium]